VLPRAITLVSFALALFSGPGWAELSVPHIFGNHMVIQRDKPVLVWGRAEAGATVEATLAGATTKAVAGADGAWRVALPALPAGGPHRMEVKDGTTTLAFDDVLVGDVWICSGQSNMQWPVSHARNSKEEIAAAGLPRIRHFAVPNVASPYPLDDCNGSWSVCSPKTVVSYTAVGFFFGRALHRELDVPIGLINTSWGGTVAEAWTSGGALNKHLPEFGPAIDELIAENAKAAKAGLSPAERLAAYRAAQQRLYALEADLAAAAARAAPDLDDSGWQTMTLPRNWEIGGLPDLDGIVWFRRTVDIPSSWEGFDLNLLPGPIDEVDVTWFNGVQVGARGNRRRDDTRFWNVARDYVVPARLVREGRSVIAIRVIDTHGQGGLWGGPAESMVLKPLAKAGEMPFALEEGDDDPIALAGEWRYDVELELPAKPVTLNNPNQPTVLFNSMIHPLIPFGIRGATWYQGESNDTRAEQYRTLLPTLIADWREHWARQSGRDPADPAEAFPFLVVQLANFKKPVAAPVQSGWAELREAQAMAVERLPNVGLAVTIDIGEAGDIHPRNKQDVGERLALAARAIAYGQDIPFSGPVFESMEVVGGEAVLSFKHTDGGLVVKGDELTGFAVRGADGEFVHADARIRDGKVIVSAEGVPAPAAVRYGWANNPPAALYNGAGLPAVPFRTDRP